MPGLFLTSDELAAVVDSDSSWDSTGELKGFIFYFSPCCLLNEYATVDLNITSVFFFIFIIII